MNYKTITTQLLAGSLLLGFVACGEKKVPLNFPKTDLSAEAIIPKPVKTVPTHSAFGLDGQTAIYTSQTDGSFAEVGSYLAETIKNTTALQLDVNQTAEATAERIIYINKAESADIANAEGYQLYITQDSIILNASDAAGAFRGVQTLRQILPEVSNDTITDHPLWLVPTGKIEDAPAFGYRGAMLDVSRHFFSVEDVKKYLDMMAYYKLNTLHLHLTDDQGWRIEIKKWPKLTEVGGATEVGGGEGGYYTQEDYKEIIAYAAARHILVIPEVDMPGHTNAASLSYPFLNGNGKALKPYTGTQVGFSTFDTRKEETYAFIDDVIGEIAAITPGPYFHVGGDESHVTKKKDFLYFIERVQKLVSKHDKTLVGWDETVQANIDPSAVIQIWRPTHTANALKAAEKGNKVILSPAHKAYLDMKYDSLSKHGLTWAAEIPVDSAYQWHPETIVKDLPRESILGIEAPLWAETITNISELEYLAFPRLIGYAELGWTEMEQRDWEDYRKRLAAHTQFLNDNNVNFYRTKLVDWQE
ncbi:family 20 glycosylhydrolase [Sediminicola luteus]|uniref:beta-N-acetylhexosaminidase n=1 Tax=Sediminicola luteus TaxID=319238 RepID=A0A2A4GAC6_9FLAO|nr:family 20 glycosylhydrolase [Sediminicola luteus]PCE64936.1 beta-N-acetylhexosaminidase [Sediminicola luteus]